MNIWAVPVIRYTARVVGRTKNELDELDRKTRKFMTANLALHPQRVVDRLYMPRNEGGGGLMQVKQTVEEEKRALCDYIQNSTEDTLKAVSQEQILNVKGTKNERKTIDKRESRNAVI